MSRLGASLIVAGLILVQLVAPAPISSMARAAADPGRQSAADAAAEFVASMNAARVEAGLHPLAVDPALTAAAAGWSTWMAEHETLQHAEDIVTGAPDDWTKVGENVGRGGSVPSIWQAFMDSPSHAANVLDPTYTRIGIAVVWTDGEILYTTHRFAGAQSDADPAPVPAPTSAPTPDPVPAPPVAAAPEEIRFADDDPARRSARVPIDTERLTATLQLLVDAVG